MTIVSVLPIGTSAVAFSGETTCFLLRIGDYTLLVDTGTNSARALNDLGVSTTTIDAVFLSHAHADHMQGLPSLVFTRSVQARNLPSPPQPLSIVASQPVTESARQALATFYADREFELAWHNTLEVETELGRLHLEPFDVEHTVPCCGFVLSLNDRPLVGFTGDTAPFDALRSRLTEVPLLLVECFGTEAQFGEIVRSAKHLSAEAANALVRESTPIAAVPFHMHVPYQRDGEPLENLRATLSAGIADGVWRFLAPGESAEIFI
jgi:ribonuclease BN (tRNA processing enzyme)